MTENEAKNFHVNTDMFGQYVKIPTGRSGDLHIYKIITRFHSNWYCDVPIIGLGDSTLHEEITDVLNVIHCGVDESKVIRVALKDCEIIENEAAKELQQYREIGTLEAVERQKEQKSDWIPVEEQLPNHDNCVLMCSHRGGMDVGWYDGKRWRTGYSHADVVNDIIAWCPLPDPYHSEQN